MQQSSYIRPPIFAVTRGAALLVEMGRDGEIFQEKKKKKRKKKKNKGNPKEIKDVKIMVQAKQLQSCWKKMNSN